jgi:hypothetical protein
MMRGYVIRLCQDGSTRDLSTPETESRGNRRGLCARATSPCLIAAGFAYEKKNIISNFARQRKNVLLDLLSPPTSRVLSQPVVFCAFWLVAVVERSLFPASTFVSAYFPPSCALE